MRLLGPVEIRQLAGRLELRPTKKLGQNFVIDHGTVRRIVALAGLRPEDVVLEVGPGFGSLTLALLAAAARVIAVEIDPVLAGELPATVAAQAPGLAGRLRWSTADAAQVRELPGPPPTVTGGQPALQRDRAGAAEHPRHGCRRCERGLVMVQAEVGRPAVRRARAAGSTACRRPSWPGTPRCGWPGRCRAACSGRCRGSTRCWWRSTAAAAGGPGQPRGGVRRHRRRVRPAPQDAAGRAGRLGRLAAAAEQVIRRGRARPGRPGRGAECGRVRPHRRGPR